jgi:hypothetical protein
MEEAMARAPQQPSSDQPDVVEELRRRDQPTPDAPAVVPHPEDGIELGGSRPPEDGGVAQHPIHDSDMEDLGPEDYEELTDEVAKVGIKP